jgi:ATP-dependent DNA helicase RecQ
MSTLIDVIRGSNKQEIIQNGYHQIKTYGVGREIDFKTWTAYITQLIDQGYLAIDFTQGNRLILTELAKPVLKSEKIVWLSEPQAIDFETTKLKQTDNELNSQDSALLDTLTQLRKRLAEEEQIQAYRIFSNAILADIARIKPGTLEAFSAISGVGEFKLNKYGADFVTLICANTAEAERTLEAKAIKPATSTSASKSVKARTNMDTFKNKTSTTIEETFELLTRGLTASEIAEQRQLKIETIYSHLFNLHLLGKDVDISPLISQQDIEHIQNKWRELNQPTSSKALYHALDERYRYDQIKFALTLAERQAS